MDVGSTAVGLIDYGWTLEDEVASFVLTDVTPVGTVFVVAK